MEGMCGRRVSSGRAVEARALPMEGPTLANVQVTAVARTARQVNFLLLQYAYLVQDMMSLPNSVMKNRCRSLTVVPAVVTVLNTCDVRLRSL